MGLYGIGEGIENSHDISYSYRMQKWIYIPSVAYMLEHAIEKHFSYPGEVPRPADWAVGMGRYCGTFVKATSMVRSFSNGDFEFRYANYKWTRNRHCVVVVEI